MALQTTLVFPMPSVATTKSASVQRRPRVPPELSDMVIDYLHNDKSALSSCSLVCKSWIAASRMHLFYQVHAMVGYQESTPADFYAFDRFLQKTPHIGNYLRTLHLSGVGNGSSPRPFLTSDILASILSRLPDIRALKLRDLRFLKSRLVHHPSYTPVDLESLVIEDIGGEHETSADFFSILSLFHKVERFTLGSIKGTTRFDDFMLWSSWSRDLDVQDIPNFQVSSLALQAARDLPFAFCSVLRRSDSINTLRSVTWDTWLDVSALSALLHEPGSRVQHLEINTNWQSGWHPVIANHPAALHLGDCASLESITLNWEVGRMCCEDDSFQRERNHRVSLATLTLLAALPDTIRRITIHFHIKRTSTLSYFENHASVNWTSLAQILEGYQELECVTFGVPDLEEGGVTRSGCQEVIETCLKTLCAKGMLRFVPSTKGSDQEWDDLITGPMPDLENFLW